MKDVLKLVHVLLSTTTNVITYLNICYMFWSWSGI